MLSDKELVEKLNWERPVEEQRKAIEEILRRKDFDISLILHAYGSSYAENAALILNCMTHDQLLPLLDGLFEWQEDLNWPGAESIRYLIAKFPKSEFMPSYEKAVQKAIMSNDDDWLGFLSWYIREHTTNVHRDDFMDKTLYDRLYACKDDYWL